MKEQIANARKRLKHAYDSFYELWGRMNKARNRNLILRDPDGFRILASVERKIDSEWGEADVLTRSPLGDVEVFSTNSPIEALSYCLAMYGRVDISYIAEVVDMDEEEVIHEMGSLIYKEPDTRIWIPAEKWLSGNVYQKMLKAQKAVEEHPSDEYLQKSLEAIKQVQVAYIPFNLLDIQCGERWVPLSYWERFGEWLLKSKITIKYVQSSDEFSVTNIGWSAEIGREYYIWTKGRRTVNGVEFLQMALENKTPNFTYTNGKGDKVVDTDSVQAANEKLDQIRTKFQEWLWQLPEEDKNNLVEIYNNLYNCYRLRKYDGSHLTLPGLDRISLKEKLKVNDVYPAQKDGAWRIISQMGGIMDWEVGAGKTMLMILASREMKRMGIRRKPCILALKANVNQIADTYRIAYPSCKVLHPTEKDFEKNNRMKLFHEMKNNDWDCIIMTHDQFGKIPQSIEIQQEVIQDELDNLEKDLQALQGNHQTITIRKGLEKKKSNLKIKLNDLLKKIGENQDNEISFNEIGIDHLFIDESHKYKNLNFTTRHDRVAGLGNQEGSQKAMNMLFAIRTLQKRFDSDLQATFLTGTPISNSLTEMYLLFKYLRPKELHRQCIYNFDAWAAVYAKKTTDFEFSVTNQIIAKERFRHFIKVPELALFYNEIADYKTNESINIDRPEMVEELIAIPATPDQKEYIQKLINFAKTGEAHYIDRPPLSESEKTAKMLIATNLAKKMSADMRLINDELYDDHPGNKISVCARKVNEFYRKFYDDKGTQLIFSDIGVPNTDKKFNLYDALKNKLVEEFEIPAEEIAFIHDYNEKTRSGLFKKINKGEVRILIGSTDKAGTGVNVQERVVAMHDLDIPWKPAELEQRGGRGARQGNWLAKLQQENKVYRYIYAVEQSLDTYKFTLLKNKQTFISQMKKSELSVRTIDEGAIDEASGMSFAEYVAILSGDTTLLEKAKIDKKIALMENLRTIHYREQSDNKNILATKKRRLEDVTDWVTQVERDCKLYESLVQRDETGTKLNPLTLLYMPEEVVEETIETPIEDIEGEIGETIEEKTTKAAERRKQSAHAERLGRFLVETYRAWRPKVGETKDKIGELYGFNVYIERAEDGKEFDPRLHIETVKYSNKIYVQHPEGGVKYIFNSGIPSFDNFKLAARNPINALDRVLNVVQNYRDEYKDLTTTIAQLETLREKPFGKEQELRELHEESKRLEMQIGQKIKDEQLQTA